MTDPDAGAYRADASWRVTNLALVVLTLILVATTVLLFSGGVSPAPGGARAKALSREYEQVTKAARAETLAFLAVDYQNMDPLIAEVLAGATGGFRREYARAQSKLKSSAQKSHAVSSGTVLSVGVGALDERKAVVLVAADSQVTSTVTRGKAQHSYYRLRLALTREGDTWLISELGPVN